MALTLKEWIESVLGDGWITLKSADPKQPDTYDPQNPRLCKHEWDDGPVLSIGRGGAGGGENGHWCNLCGAVKWPDGSITVEAWRL